MRLMVELEGRTVPLLGCDWVLFQSCGCPRGVHVVTSDVVTEEAVWKEFFPRKRERDAAQRRGLRMELVTHETCRAEVLPKMRLSYVCPHMPTLEASNG